MRGKLVGLACAGLIFLGAFIFFLGLRRPVVLTVDGVMRSVNTRAFSVAGVLADAGVEHGADDLVVPPPGHLIGWNRAIRVEHSRPVVLWGRAEGLPRLLFSPERIPGNLLQGVSIRLYPGDRIYWEGVEVKPGQAIPQGAEITLDLHLAQPITLTDNGNTRVVYSAAPTLGGALWEAGIRLSGADTLSPGPDTVLDGPVRATLSRAVPVTIQVEGETITSLSSADTVGLALASAGVALLGMDYSLPAEDQSLPADGVIRVVRVREEILLEQTTIPFEVEYVADPETELDQTRIVEAGQYGLQVSRTRLRFEDGMEVRRDVEATWTASEPVSQKIGYGTQVVIRTLDTPEGPIEYWRAITVYATSYSPCRSAADRCYYGTAYGVPVARGVIGTSRTWYNLMAGWPVYVPNYGKAIIADLGAVPGYWIDLGYTDADYVGWHQNVTLYFLTPVPANIPWILPD